MSLADGVDIDEEKITFLPSIPNGVGAILNETQAKQTIYLILTGVGPGRREQVMHCSELCPWPWSQFTTDRIAAFMR